MNSPVTTCTQTGTPISNSLVDYHSSGVANNTHGYTISSTGFLSFSVQRGYIISYHISSWLYHIIYPLYYDYIILKKYLPQNGWSCNWPPIFLGFNNKSFLLSPVPPAFLSRSCRRMAKSHCRLAPPRKAVTVSEKWDESRGITGKTMENIGKHRGNH